MMKQTNAGFSDIFCVIGRVWLDFREGRRGKLIEQVWNFLISDLKFEI